MPLCNGDPKKTTVRKHVEKKRRPGSGPGLGTFKELMEVAEKERPGRCYKQLGEGVAMATKVVRSFKEKVINIVKCGSEFQSDEDRNFLFGFQD